MQCVAAAVFVGQTRDQNSCRESASDDARTEALPAVHLRENQKEQYRTSLSSKGGQAGKLEKKW